MVIRHWQSDADYGAMADVSNACADVDRLDGFAGPEDFGWMARYLPGFRAEDQIVLAEADGAPIGFAYARLGGFEDGTGHIVSLQFRSLPSWRPQGLPATLLARAEAIGLGLWMRSPERTASPGSRRRSSKTARRTPSRSWTATGIGLSAGAIA